MAPTWPKVFFGPWQGHRLGQTLGQSQFGPHLAYLWRMRLSFIVFQSPGVNFALATAWRAPTLWFHYE